MNEEQANKIIELLTLMINSENDQKDKRKPQASLTDIYNELVELNKNISRLNQI